MFRSSLSRDALNSARRQNHHSTIGSGIVGEVPQFVILDVTVPAHGKSLKKRFPSLRAKLLVAPTNDLTREIQFNRYCLVLGMGQKNLLGYLVKDRKLRLPTSSSHNLKLTFTNSESWRNEGKFDVMVLTASANLGFEDCASNQISDESNPCFCTFKFVRYSEAKA